MIIKVKSKQQGSHVHADFFMGEDDGHLGSVGMLTMRLTEFQLFIGALKNGAKEAGMTLRHEYASNDDGENMAQTSQAP